MACGSSSSSSSSSSSCVLQSTSFQKQPMVWTLNGVLKYKFVIFSKIGLSVVI